MICPRCREPMTVLFAGVSLETYDGTDEHLIWFLERRNAGRWDVYECASCDCGCRGYQETPNALRLN